MPRDLQGGLCVICNTVSGGVFLRMQQGVMPCTGPVQCSLRCCTAAEEDVGDLEPTGTGLAGLGENVPIFSTLPQPITEHLLAHFSLQDLVYNKQILGPVHILQRLQFERQDSVGAPAEQSDIEHAWKVHPEAGSSRKASQLLGVCPVKLLTLAVAALLVACCVVLNQR